MHTLITTGHYVADGNRMRRFILRKPVRKNGLLFFVTDFCNFVIQYIKRMLC